MLKAQVKNPSSLPNIDLEKVPVSEVQTALKATLDGLTTAEAVSRQQQYGVNELAERKVNPWIKFLSYFWGPIPWMIEIAAILSAVVQHWPDFGIIMTLLIVNALVGWSEEHKAGNAIAALKAKLALQARVRRDGNWVSLAARELVPGDLIRLRMGDIIPADARLLDGDPVQVDQSALTGESLPVTHQAGDAVYSGSIIKQGEINGLVYATGTNSYFGKTARLVDMTENVSHFQKAVMKIGNFLIVIAIVLVAVIMIVSAFRHDPFLDTLQFALVLTIAAIPVAMPAVLSVTMAIGASNLAKKQAIVTRLTAIEELAGINILCSDKTGTLTKNELTLGEPRPIGANQIDNTILAAALASKAENQDPIDLAVLASVKDASVLNDYRVLSFKPFDPVSKRTEATIQTPDGKTLKVTKGAPQVILSLVNNAAAIEKDVEAAINEFASRGFRALGVAQTDEQGNWQYLGILPMFDPPRDDSASTIKAAHEMGLDVKMVTGDQLAIAQETARQLGLKSNIIKADIFATDEKEPLAAKIQQAEGFAQVFPEHKYHIVDVLKQRGNMVGMTGDGVNDAPALKKADVGIAVSGATDAARAAADIVLTSPGLSVIIDAIHESRRIFERMNNYAIYRIIETIRVLLFMTLAILVFNFYPVTAVMIVILALLNDGAILTIAYDNVEPSGSPRAWNMPEVLTISSVLGVIGVVSSFVLFFLGEKVFHLDRNIIQSLIFLKLSVAGHLTYFLARTRGPWYKSRPANVVLLAIFGTKIIGTIMAVYGIFVAPIGWGWAIAVWAYAVVWFLFNDRLKLFAYHLLDVYQKRSEERELVVAPTPALDPNAGR